MKQYTIAIPEEKDAFFQEFMRMAGIYVIDAAQTDIPQWHIQLVRNRVASATSENMLDWDDIKHTFKLD
jgi:hypothetical protein